MISFVNFNASVMRRISTWENTQNDPASTTPSEAQSVGMTKTINLPLSFIETRLDARLPCQTKLSGLRIVSTLK